MGLALILKHWRILLLAGLVAFIVGFLWRHIHNDNQTRLALVQAQAQLAAAQEAVRQAEASAEAAKAARETNDRELGRIRSDTQGRVDRAATADAAQRVSDAQAALDAYRAAASGLRAKDPG